MAWLSKMYLSIVYEKKLMGRGGCWLLTNDVEDRSIEALNFFIEYSSIYENISIYLDII